MITKWWLHGWNEESRSDADKRGGWVVLGAVLNKKLINKVGSDGSLEETIYTEMAKTFQIIKKKLFKFSFLPFPS